MTELKHYGSTASEKKLAKIQSCRDIVRTVVQFGVDQEQLLTLIRLLALELEDHEAMVQITEVVKGLEQPTLFIDQEENTVK